MVCFQHYFGHIVTVNFIGEGNSKKRQESHQQATTGRQSLSHDFCCKVVLVNM